MRPSMPKDYQDAERRRQRAGKMNVEELRAEYWRLQDALEALPQETYEGPQGERLTRAQDPVVARLEELLGPDWMFAANARTGG